MDTSNTHMHKGTSPPPKSVQQSTELLVMDATSKTHTRIMHQGTSSPPKTVHTTNITTTVTPAPVPARMSS
jgi:hypothetical protein